MILDLLVLSVMSLTQFNFISSIPLLVSSATYLSLKGLVFRDFMSMLDLSVGIYLVLMIFGIKIMLIYYLALGWFLYKLLFTFLS
jgi:hypothetical protein